VESAREGTSLGSLLRFVRCPRTLRFQSHLPRLPGNHALRPTWAVIMPLSTVACVVLPCDLPGGTGAGCCFEATRVTIRKDMTVYKRISEPFKGTVTGTPTVAPRRGHCFQTTDQWSRCLGSFARTRPTSKLVWGATPPHAGITSTLDSLVSLVHTMWKFPGIER